MQASIGSSTNIVNVEIPRHVATDMNSEEFKPRNSFFQLMPASSAPVREFSVKVDL